MLLCCLALCVCFDKYFAYQYDYASFRSYILTQFYLLKADPYYAAFHDEEWGVPVHDDKYGISTLLESILIETGILF